MNALALLGIFAALDAAAVARLLKLSLHEQERPREPARLAVKLHGTMVAHDRRFSFALVEGRSVFVGDRVEGRLVTDVVRGCLLFEFEELCLQKKGDRHLFGSAAGDVANVRDPKRSPSPFFHVTLSSFIHPQLRIVPTPGGFKILNVPKGSIYEDLGIQSGDILKTVNGKPATFEVLPLVKPGAVLRVELERNGQLYALEGQLD